MTGRRYALDCLRFASDIRNLAWTGGTPEETKSLLKLAEIWTNLADQAVEEILFQDHSATPKKELTDVAQFLRPFVSERKALSGGVKKASKRSRTMA